MPDIGLLRAGADVGRGARDRSGDADTAKQGGSDIGDALRDQLHVVAVLASGHAVGDLRREQALDPAEQREGQRGRQDLEEKRSARATADAASRQAMRRCRRNGVPIVSTGKPKQPEPRPRRTTTAISMPGQAGRQRRSKKIKAAEPTPTASAAEIDGRQRLAERREFREQRHRARRQPTSGRRDPSAGSPQS